jgi:FdhE protein
MEKQRELLSVKRLQNELEEARKFEPRLSSLLDLFEKIYLFQIHEAIKESAKFNFHEEKFSNKKPFLHERKLDIDLNTFYKRFKKAARILNEASEKSVSSKEISNFQPKELTEAANNLIFFPERLEEKWQKENIPLLLKETLTTFYAAASHSFFSQINTEKWEKGICPLCGQKPFISRLDKENGSRYLKCHLCYLEWRFPRLSCPFCGNEEGKSLSYFYADEDKAHRIEVCENCKRYLKTIDERLLKKEVEPLVRDIIMIGLEEAVREKGYSSWSE